MDDIAPEDRDFDVDLESGLEVGVEQSRVDPITGARVQENRLLAEFSGVFVYGTTRGEESVNLCSTVPNFSGVSKGHVKSDGRQSVDHAEKKVVKEKCKKASNKKPPKPPRPPRGPSLDAADQKLIKEISELAMLKRARIERMKALEKMKTTKSSSNSSLFAMVFTILFCLVIIFQGMSSRVTSVKLDGPVPAGAAEGSLISVQYFVNPSANHPNRTDSGSVEPAAGSDPREDMRKAAE